MSSTILIVDDDDATRAATERILSKAGYKVVTAATGEEGIARLSHEKIDLVLTDLRMPRTDGVDIMIELQKHRANVPVIAMSAYGPKTASNYLKIAQLVGAQATLEKPFTRSQLLEAIASALPA